MRPQKLKTRIFLDGGNPAETKEVIKKLGFLDGQTTNPTLISRNPNARERIEQSDKFSESEILGFYHGVVTTLCSLMPEGSVSVEVYADAATQADAMLRQAKEMFSWIRNAHVKFPTTREGLKAAERAVQAGMRVNMTLCFSQEQAAAVYAATRGAKKGQVFVSPFVGRLDSRGENGMDVVANILRMYAQGDGHVEVLTASVRSMDHFLQAIKLGSDIVTVPYDILITWAKDGKPIPDDTFIYDAKSLSSIPYREIALTQKWQDYDIRHDLTIKGMEMFSADWNALIKATVKMTA